MLALVEKDSAQRLVVAAGSANLTRAGWWQSVECAHVTSIAAGEATWLRDDLLRFVRYLQRQERSPNHHSASRPIRAFLTATRQRLRHAARDDAGRERFIWNGVQGQVDLVELIHGRIGGRYAGGTVEIISPWFSDTGDDTLRRLIKGPACPVL